MKFPRLPHTLWPCEGDFRKPKKPQPKDLLPRLGHLQVVELKIPKKMAFYEWVNLGGLSVISYKNPISGVFLELWAHLLTAHLTSGQQKAPLWGICFLAILWNLGTQMTGRCHKIKTEVGPYIHRISDMEVRINGWDQWVVSLNLLVNGRYLGSKSPLIRTFS